MSRRIGMSGSFLHRRPQPGHDALADDTQRPGLGEAGHGQHQRDAHEQEQQLVQATRVPGADHLVDQAADDQAPPARAWISHPV